MTQHIYPMQAVEKKPCSPFLFLLTVQICRFSLLSHHFGLETEPCRSSIAKTPLEFGESGPLPHCSSASSLPLPPHPCSHAAADREVEEVAAEEEEEEVVVAE